MYTDTGTDTDADADTDTDTVTDHRTISPTTLGQQQSTLLTGVHAGCVAHLIQGRAAALLLLLDVDVVWYPVHGMVSLRMDMSSH
jgi:hypothetical protein